MPPNSKTYRIEKVASGTDLPSGSMTPDIPTELRTFQEVLIQELGELKAVIRPNQGRTASADVPAVTDWADIAELRDDIQSVSGSIQETRRQLAAMHVGTPHDINIQGIHEELGAVVSDAEQATNTILDAAEEIRTSAEVLREGIASPQDHIRLDHIQQEIMRVLEACSFQDLTGQRIGRVVDTLGFIEQRLERILETWGGIDAIQKFMAEHARTLEAERESEGSFALARGPQIFGEGGHIDQGGIDALFS